MACADFTVADIMMAGVLRGVRRTDLMEPFPKAKACYGAQSDSPGLADRESRLHLGEFTALFVQVVKLARELGLTGFGPH